MSVTAYITPCLRSVSPACQYGISMLGAYMIFFDNRGGACMILLGYIKKSINKIFYNGPIVSHIVFFFFFEKAQSHCVIPHTCITIDPRKHSYIGRSA